MKFWKDNSSLLIKLRNLQKMNPLSNKTDFDVLQSYTKPGVYQVKGALGLPENQDYQLIVAKNGDGELIQSLIPLDSTDMVPRFMRKYDERIDRFRAFVDVETDLRYKVEQYLKNFADRVIDSTDADSVNIGVITDTHDKDVDAIDFYGYNGLVHTNEFSLLEKQNVLDLKVHLGDWIDGSDDGTTSKNRLIGMRDTFQTNQTPYFNVKGNHDDNDKYDEHHDRKVSFKDREFEDLMWPMMYRQKDIHYQSTKNGVGYFDRGDLRVIFINTSDVPYIVEDGVKKYDTKLTLGVREDQVEELIEILSASSGKQILVMGHANLINRKGNNALKYNGRTLHELLVAFNQKEKGQLFTTGVPNEFELRNHFDFSQVENSKIFGYVCGHRHIEDNYMINGIQYVLLNCSALMGKGYTLTTAFNKKWDRKIDHPNESAGYILNVNLPKKEFQVFGYGAATFRSIYKI